MNWLSFLNPFTKSRRRRRRSKHAKRGKRNMTRKIRGAMKGG